MKDSYNCIIIDDDELDRLTIYALARKYAFLNITGVFDSADNALKSIGQQPIDILLSDIDMPGINGLDFRKKLSDIPVCIFITSYPDYAPESFELSTLDFIVKPVKADRFDTAMKRCQEYLDIKHKAELFEYSLGGDTIFIKDGHNHIKIALHQVIYLEALKDYTIIVTPAKNYYVLSGISSLLKEKSFQSFIRIHRSYAVQKHFINFIAPQQVTVGNIKLPIGRSYKENLDAIML
jgi:two-component system, LytTR family, response regulator